MFNRSRPDRDDRRRFSPYWSGRASRAEYWMAVGLVTLVGLMLPRVGASGGAGVMLIFTIRRLHDFGRSGWWSALPLAAAVPVGVALAAHPILGSLLYAGLIVGAVMFTAFVGLMPGDEGPNRFGEPQPLFRRKRPLADMFS